MTAPRSPWWFRGRAYLIGAVYVLGFAPYAIPPGADPAFVVWGLPHGEGAVDALAWLGIALGVLGWALRAWGTAYLRREVVFSADVRRERLVVAGPFRFVRNPLYLGNVLLAAGLGLYAPPIGWAIVVVGNALVVVLFAGEEARELALRYGETFAAFRRAVPAFVPRLTPADVPGTVAVAPSLDAALRGEAPVLLLALSPAPIALWGEAGIRAFQVLWVAALLLGIVLNRQRRVPRTSGTPPET